MAVGSFTGAVLAGGRSARMGRDKALVAFRGRPLAAYGFNALREAGATRTLAIGGDGPALVEIGYEAVADRHPGEGPLGGVLTALNASDTALMAILACDQPAVDAALILELLSTLETVDADAAVVAVAGRHHPLPMAIRASAATHLLAAYRAGERSLVGALRSLRVQALARQTDATVFDLDDPADLRRYAATIRNRDPARSPVDVPEIDIDLLEHHRAAGAPLIDVRQPDEYEEAHVPGAKLIPLGDLPDRLDEIPTDAPVYLICRSGGRSRRAAQFLIQGGIDATNVAGGTAAWIEAGKPVATGSEPT